MLVRGDRRSGALCSANSWSKGLEPSWAVLFEDIQGPLGCSRRNGKGCWQTMWILWGHFRALPFYFSDVEEGVVDGL